MNSTPWRKSSRSGGDGGNGQCVEARTVAGKFQVRDSKLGDASPVFDMDQSEFAGLLSTINKK